MAPSLATSHDPSLYLERQMAVYIGRVLDGEESDAKVAYYLHSRDDLFIGSLSEDGFEPFYTLENGTATMGEAVATFNDLETSTTELSIIGEALWKAQTLAETGILGLKQTCVYVLREIYRFNQQDTAKILDIGYSTVSTHLSDARRNVARAITFADQHDELIEMRTELPA